MPKGSGVVTKSVKSLPMSKNLSKSHMPMPQGKMSSAHGVTNGGGKHKTLMNASGAVGGCCKTPGHMISQGPKKVS